MQAMYHLERKKGRNRKRKLLNFIWRNLLKVGFPKRKCQDLKEDIDPSSWNWPRRPENQIIAGRNRGTPELSPGEARAPL